MAFWNFSRDKTHPNPVDFKKTILLIKKKDEPKWLHH